jgi:hypothetical protein
MPTRISNQVKIKLSKGCLFYLKIRYLCCEFAQGIAAASFFMWYQLSRYSLSTYKKDIAESPTLFFQGCALKLNN